MDIVRDFEHGTLSVSETTAVQLADHGTTVDDAVAAVAFGEQTGKKFVRKGAPARFIARVPLERINAYAQYEEEEPGRFRLLTAYVHRASFMSDYRGPQAATFEEPSSWTCAACGCDVDIVSDIQLTYLIDGEDLDAFPVPPQSGLRCPQCGREMLQRKLVYELLENAEKMLEAK